MEFDFSGSFVNAENVKKDDVLTIVAQPVPQEKESNDMTVIDGVMKKKKYMVLNMDVEYDGKRKTYTPDSNTGKRFQAFWGMDYTKWIGKQFSVKIETYKAFGVDKTRVAGFPVDKVE